MSDFIWAQIMAFICLCCIFYEQWKRLVWVRFFTVIKCWNAALNGCLEVSKYFWRNVLLWYGPCMSTRAVVVKLKSYLWITCFFPPCLIHLLTVLLWIRLFDSVVYVGNYLSICVLSFVLWGECVIYLYIELIDSFCVIKTETSYFFFNIYMRFSVVS